MPLTVPVGLLAVVQAASYLNHRLQLFRELICVRGVNGREEARRQAGDVIA